MQKLSVKWKLIIIHLVVIIPLIAALVYSHYSWQKRQIEKVLFERVEVANLVGTNFYAQIKEIRNLMLLTGRQIKNSRYSRSKAIAELSKLQSMCPADFVLFTDEVGTVVVSTDSRLAGLNLSDNPAFAGIISGNKQSGIAPIERVSGTAGFYVTQAIIDNGQQREIVAVFIGISKLDLALPVDLNIGNVNIIDSNGRLVYENKHPNLAETSPYWSKYDCVRKALAGKTSTSKDWISPGDNRKHFVAEVPIKEIGWVAGSDISSNEAMVSMKEAVSESTKVVIIVLLASLLVSINFARKIAVPLVALVEKSKSIGEEGFEEPVELDTGDEIGEVAHSLDDTKRSLKQKVEELKRSRDELEQRVEERTAELSNIAGSMRLLLESTSEGIYGIDTKGRCTFFNRSATVLTGYSSEEMLGKVVHNIIHDKHSNGSPYLMEDCIIEQIINTGENIRNSTEVFWRKNDSSFPVEYSASPIMEDGIIRGAVITFIDITGRKKEEELRLAIHEINDAISSMLNIDEIMKTVVSETVKALNAESGAILMHEDDRWIIKYGYGAFEKIIGIELTGEKIQHLVNAVKNGDILVIKEVEKVDKEEKSIDEICKIRTLKNIKACVDVPLLVKDNLLGILIIAYSEAPVLFTKSQLDFINKLVASISLALENARLYETERDIANTLQESLLVLPEKIEGISYGSLYRSATVAAKVGGDFFDLFEMEHNKIGIVIGDVSGKGIEASTLTSVVKNTLRAYAYEENLPATIIKKTNDAIWKSSPPGLFITLFFGILDVSSEDLIYCNAGHPAPLIIKRKLSEIKMLEANSPVIGVFPDLTFLNENTSVIEDETLFLYTDGVIEAKCADGFFGEERLCKMIKQFEPKAAESLPGLIFNEVARCSGGNLSDDIAILAISRQRNK